MRGVELWRRESTLRHERGAVWRALGRQFARVAGRRHFAPRAVGPDHAAPALRILMRQQRLDRHIDDTRIAEISLAIGECELHRLGDAMKICWRVVAERAQ